MNLHDEMDELTPEERAMFDALPREREPGRLLEERTVRALREHGLIRTASAAPAVAEAPSRRAIRFPAAWISGAMAAGIALFLGGLATGQYVAQRNASDIVAQVQKHDAQQAALMVQQTGSAYVQALSRLQQVSDTSRASRQQASEVASSMLRAAADEVVRLNPNDPVASGILAAFDRARVQPSGAQRDTAGKQSMVWF